MENQRAFPYSFGELLKASRKRQGLTQKHLAQQLGVHANTVSSWELGTYLPATRGLVLELARHLVLNELETRHLLEASLTALPPHWHVPFPRNLFFTGREEMLAALHTCLHAERGITHKQPYALHGLGGIGKTQIALEYAYQHALEYSAVFWIGAETSEHIVSGLLQIAEVLQLPGRDDKDQQRVVAAVQHWLMTHSQWLLIWDNLEDLDLLHHFLPSIRQGAILITTRCQALGTLARGIDLAPMEPEEGILFVLRRTKVLEPEATHEHVQQFAIGMPDEYAAATELVTSMAALPLALDQAGAYIDETGCSLASYLHRYQQQRACLLDRRGGPGNDHPQSVTATFSLSMERVEREHQAAADVLRVCAFLHAEAIPEELFVEGGRHLGAGLETLATDPSRLDQAIAVLRSLSLIQRQAAAHTLSLHRLVQTVLRERMSEQEQAAWRRRVVAALDAVFPEVSHEAWSQCERLLSHVLTVAVAIPDQAGNQHVARVVQKAAGYLGERAQYEQAEPLYQRALRLLEQALGAEHPETTYALNGLATLYFRQGKYAQAEPLYQRALHLLEQTLGPEHPHVARPLDGLAILYSQQGKYKQADPLYRRALHIWEQALGQDHPLVAHALNGLANLFSEQGKDEQAEPLYQRALHIWEQTLGPEHPEVAYPLISLADLSLIQGRYEQAESLYQRALHIWEQTLGPEHPEAAYALNGLATLYLSQRKYEEAALFYKRALRLREQHLGQDHPETAQTLHDLANLRQKQGDLSEALSFAAHALQIRSQSLGDMHPKTIATRTLHTQLVQEHRCMEEQASPSRQQASTRMWSRTQERLLVPEMNVVIRGATEQVAYTRHVRMREVTFTCTICGQTVTQQHYPSGQIKYCSETCRAVRATQAQKERVARQREKRRIEREAHLRGQQQDTL